MSNLIQRVTKGGYVRASHQGCEYIGVITGWDHRSIIYETLDEEGDKVEFEVERSAAFKASKKEYEKFVEATKYAVDELLGNPEGVDHDALVEQEARDSDEGEEPEVDEENEKSIVKKRYRQRYAKSKSASGNSSKICGDGTSKELEGLTLDEAYHHVADVTGEDVSDMVQRWAHLNVGQQRMLVGNKLRKFYKDGMDAGNEE